MGRRWSGWRVPVCCIISLSLKCEKQRVWLAVGGRAVAGTVGDWGDGGVGREFYQKSKFQCCFQS